MLNDCVTRMAPTTSSEAAAANSEAFGPDCVCWQLTPPDGLLTQVFSSGPVRFAPMSVTPARGVMSSQGAASIRYPTRGERMYARPLTELPVPSSGLVPNETEPSPSPAP